MRVRADGKQVIDGWSTSVTLLTGEGSQLGTEKVAHPQGKIQSLQCQLPESGDFTIEFGIQILDGPDKAHSALYMAEAIVLLTVEGNTVQRRISIANGATITGVAQNVRVIMWDTTPTSKSTYLGAAFNQIGLRYDVSAQIALGTRAAKNIQPQLTPGQAVLDPGSTGTLVNLGPGAYSFASGVGDAIDIPIPQDAGINDVMVLCILTTAGGLEISPKLGSVLASFDNTSSGQTVGSWYPLLNGGIWVPVPAGADQLSLTAAETNPDTGFQAIVFFGIDG